MRGVDRAGSGDRSVPEHRLCGVETQLLEVYRIVKEGLGRARFQALQCQHGSTKQRLQFQKTRLFAHCLHLSVGSLLRMPGVQWH